MRFALLALAPALLAAIPLCAQQNLPQWRLTKQSASIGEEIELHRVRAATELPDGTIAIADAGNTRVVIASASGQSLRQFGRAGSGPGDFRALLDLISVGDTIVTYDAELRRVSRFLSDGTFLRSSQLPMVDDRPVVLRAFESSSAFLVTSTSSHTEREGGLFIDSVSVLRVGASGGATPLAREAWENSYQYRQESGTTTYSTPFLGRAMIFAAAGKTVIVPLAAAHVVMLRPDGRRSTPVELGVARRPFDRALVDAYRDSLLTLIRDENTAARVNSVFGSTFPTPRDRPFFEFGRAIGDQVWLRSFPVGNEPTSTWHVFDAKAERYVARVTLPRTSRVLGGAGSRLIVLERDESYVEYVAIHLVTRP